MVDGISTEEMTKEQVLRNLQCMIKIKLLLKQPRKRLGKVWVVNNIKESSPREVFA